MQQIYFDACLHINFNCFLYPIKLNYFQMMHKNKDGNIFTMNVMLHVFDKDKVFLNSVT